MPNKYEREIEEILRNLEQTEPRGARGSRFTGRARPKQGHSMRVRGYRFPSFHLNFGAAEWLLLICVGAALLAGGFAYTQPFHLGNIYTGIGSLVSLVCLVLVIVMPFISARRRYSTQSTRYGNVTPLRRNPIAGLANRWRLFLLKLRYRRRRDL